MNSLDCNSLIAAFNCGTDALIFGNFIILASGFLASSPNSLRWFGTFWSSVKKSGKTAKILAANEMSLVSIVIPDDLEKAFTTANHE